MDANDIADVVVEALMHDKHDGKLYELTGPKAITFREVVSTIAQTSGRDLHFQAISM